MGSIKGLLKERDRFGDINLSIVIPTFNRLNYLQKCIDSIVKNTKINYEMIVVDGGSTDGTKEFLLSLQPNVKILEDELEGPVKATNKGFREAQGEYVCWLNDDIVVLNDAFDRMIEFLDTHPDIGLGAFYLNEGGNVFGRCFGRYYGLLYANLGMMRTSLMRELGYLDESFLWYSVDIDLSLKVWERGLAVVECKEAKLLHFSAEDERREFSRSIGSKDSQALEERWKDKMESLIESIPESLIKRYFHEEERIELFMFKTTKLHQKKAFKEAKDALKRILSLKHITKSRRYRYLLHLVDLYSHQGKFKEAEEELKKVLSLELPERLRFDALVQLAHFYSHQGKFKEAEEELKKALFLKPKDKYIKTSTYYAHGSNYEREGKLDKAKEKFEKVIKLAEEIPTLLLKNRFIGGAHFHLGCIYKELGKEKEAKHHLKECLKFIPEHRMARKILREVRNGQ